MPRIARPPSPEVVRAREKLRAYLSRHEMSGNQLARVSGVSQSTLSRFLGGITKNLNSGIRPVLDYAGIETETSISYSPEHPDNLGVRELLDNAKAGDPEAAQLLGRLIEAMVPILKSYTPRKRGSVQ